MHRVALLGELCSREVFHEARKRGTVAEGPVSLAVKEKLLFGIPSLEPALEGEEGIIGNVDHSPHAVLLSLEEMDLSVTKIEIVEREAEGFTDPDARPQKQQDEGPVPGVVDHGEELSHILGVYGPGKRVGELEPDRLLQGSPGDDILLDQEVEKGNDAGHPGLHRGDVQYRGPARVR